MMDPNPLRWPVITGAALVGVLCWARNGAEKAEWPLVALLAYTGASLLWSPDPRAGIVYYAHWLALGVVFVWAKGNADILGKLAAIAIAVQVAICAVFPNIYGGLGNENFQAEFLVIAAVLALTDRRNPWCVLMACVAVVQVLFFNISNAKFVALLCFVAFLNWRIMILAAMAAVAGAFVFWESVIDRFEFAYNTFTIWLDYPLFGYGLGGFDYLYPGYAENHMAVTGQSRMDGLKWYAGAAHNEFMQFMAELGLVGFALLVLVARAYVRNWLILTPLVGLCLVGFPLQNPSTALLAVMLLGAASSQISFPSRSSFWRSTHGAASWASGIFRRRIARQ